MVDPDNPTAVVPVRLEPKSITETIGLDAMRAGPYACLLLFALWWMNTQWQADKVAAASAQSAQILATAEAVKEQARLAAVAVEKVAVQQTIQLRDQAEDCRLQVATVERLLSHKSEMNAAKINEVAKKVDSLAP